MIRNHLMRALVALLLLAIMFAALAAGIYNHATALYKASLHPSHTLVWYCPPPPTPC